MSDSVTVTESYGQRLIKSVIGVVVGVVLFFASFAVLWWNEGNIAEEKAALEQMRKEVVKADANAPSKARQGRLIHATGKLDSTEKVGDSPYLIPGPYLALSREVEMFQWVEKSEKKGKTTTYTYQQKWASGVADSANFHSPDGHQNPPLAIEPKLAMVKHATFGKMDGAEVVRHLTPTTKVSVTKAMMPPKSTLSVANGMIFKRVNAKAAGDQLGDVRISYRAVTTGTYSVVAKQAGNGFETYVAKNGKQKFLVSAGTTSPKAMIQNAVEGAKFFAMLLRFLGFFLMFIGLCLMGGPVSALLDFLPFVGTASRFVLGAVFFVVAAALSTLTIVVSMIAHNPIALVVAVLALGGFAYWRYQQKKNRPAASPQQAVQQAARRAA